MKYFTILLIFSIILLDNASGQTGKTAEFRYLSPVPGAGYVLPESNIAFRSGNLLPDYILKEISVKVTGSVSGPAPGELILSDDQKTLIFNPDIPFQWGEHVDVIISGKIKTKEGTPIDPVSFGFDIAKSIPDRACLNRIYDEPILPQKIKTYYHQKSSPVSKSVKDNNLPDDFPELTVNYSNNPADGGYYFISPFGYWGWFPDNVPYLIIMDNKGIPVFYKKLDGHGYDFRFQPNGHLSFFYNQWPTPYHIEMDSSYRQVNTYQMGNGYGYPDFHEFHLLQNGHAIVMCYDPQFVDMSQVVQGGQPNAIVDGWIIQELDASKNVIFQWRSWDHYALTDADEHVDLTDTIIDLIHGNSIEVMDDAMLLSPRNFDEITKIDRNTGDIIWRLGGKNNMFDFINDTLRFSRAHDIRLQPDGHITLFDNGTYHPEPQFSSMVEYAIDESNFTVSLVRRLRSDPDIFGIIMGNVQVTSENRKVVGWGSGVPGLTEFNQNDDPDLEIYFAGINYRAYHFPWSTNYFTCSADSLQFGYLWYQDTLTKQIKLFNHQDVPIEITGYYTNGNAFTVENEFPFIIPAQGSKNITVKFSPDNPGTFRDVLTLNSDINTQDLVQRIAQQVKLIGYATEGQSVHENGPFQTVKVYPNPVSDLVTLNFGKTIASGRIIVMDGQGKKFKERVISNSHKINLDLSTLPAGFYIIRVMGTGEATMNPVHIVKE